MNKTEFIKAYTWLYGVNKTEAKKAYKTYNEDEKQRLSKHLEIMPLNLFMKIKKS